MIRGNEKEVENNEFVVEICLLEGMEEKSEEEEMHAMV